MLEFVVKFFVNSLSLCFFLVELFWLDYFEKTDIGILLHICKGFFCCSRELAFLQVLHSFDLKLVNNKQEKGVEQELGPSDSFSEIPVKTNHSY